MPDEPLGELEGRVDVALCGEGYKEKVDAAGGHNRSMGYISMA